jgi:hypothetical protein
MDAFRLPLTGGLLFVWVCAIGLGLTCGKPSIDHRLAINGT